MKVDALIRLILPERLERLAVSTKEYRYTKKLQGEVVTTLQLNFDIDQREIEANIEWITTAATSDMSLTPRFFRGTIVTKHGRLQYRSCFCAKCKCTLLSIIIKTPLIG